MALSGRGGSTPPSSTMEVSHETSERGGTEDAPGSNPGGPRGREGSTPSARTKLYIVLDAGLRPGQKLAQACHAMRQWTAEHPEEDRRWFEESNTLVLLEAANESDLTALVGRARDAGVSCVEFREPDMEDRLTAIAIGPLGSVFVAQLPLALRDRKGGLAP